MTTAFSILQPSLSPAPPGWIEQRIGDVVELINGFPFPSDSFSPAGALPLVRIRDLTAREFETYIRPPVPQRVIIRDGDVVVGMDGEFNVVTWNRGPAALNQRLCLLRPKPGVDVRFVAYWLPALLRVLNDLAYSTTVKHLSSGEILSERILMPGLDAQRDIADFLDDQVARLDRAIELRRRAVTLSQAKSWSTWIDHLADADAPNVPLRRFFTDLADGPFGSAFTSADYSSTGARVVRLGNIGFAEYRTDDEAFLPLDIWSQFPRCHVQTGDLLIAGLGDERNHAGRACVAPDLAPALVKGKCFRARVDDAKADPRFVALTLSSPLGAELLSIETRGSTRGMINLEIIKSVAIPLPPVDVQRRMVQSYAVAREEIDRLIELEERSLVLLEERKQALITAAVTGQFDVTTARAVA